MKWSLPLKIIYRGLLGLVVFVIILGIANFLKAYINHPFYHFFVNTFNSALWIIIALSVLFLAADFFRVLQFPYNLPCPIINAFAYVYLTSFLFELIPLVEYLAKTEMPWDFGLLRAILAVSVFALVAVMGYVNIFIKKYRKENKKEKKPSKK
ncbi:MAG: hypothetical protein KKE05_02300 [Nanoarchaeota archaeon]|nr:hypothetical protein [Nanoarchaeota archaeon]